MRTEIVATYSSRVCIAFHADGNHDLFFSLSLCLIDRSRAPERVRSAAGVKKAAEVAHGLHQPPDLRVREALPVPEVPLSG